MAAKERADRKKSKMKIDRRQRPGSNVFVMFNKEQIEEFKEAFNLIDTSTRDGTVTREDLVDTFTSLGKNVSGDEINEMLTHATGPINFTMFLTMFGERMVSYDPEELILNAFAIFDPKGTGFITEEKFRDIFITMGDRWSEDQVDELLRDAPIKDGMLNYEEFTKMLKHGKEDDV